MYSSLDEPYTYTLIRTSESHLHYRNYFESDLVQLTKTAGTHGAAINLCKFPVIFYICAYVCSSQAKSGQSRFTI